MAGRTAIGLDIGTSSVRAAELSFGKQDITLEKFGQVAVPPGTVRDGEVIDSAAVSAAIKQLWSVTGFSHKKVTLGVANQRVIVRQVELPWLPPAELRQGLAFQVQDLLPMPVDQAVLDFHPLEDLEVGGARTLKGLLVAASRDTVLTNVRCVEQAGLTPTVVDLTSFAVLRSLAHVADAQGHTEALVDVGARVTNVVVHADGAPRFVRILLMGGQDITDAVAERLGIGQDEAEAIKQRIGSAPGQGDPAAQRAVEAEARLFVDEIRGSLDYYTASNPGMPIERLVMSGGGSLLSGLAEQLAQAVRVPVAAGDALSALHLGQTGLDARQLAHVQSVAAVPVGLALGGVR